MGQIRITIFRDGYVSTETQGIKGKKCDLYKDLLEKLLNYRVIENEHTDEYYEQNEQIEYENEAVKLYEKT